MNTELFQRVDILNIILKVMLAFISGKLFSHILTGSDDRRFDTIFVMATLLPALLMILILEIQYLYYFEYFLIGGMALLVGIAIGRRSLKWVEMPLHLLFLLGMIGSLFGLGFYGLAVVGIICGVITFFKYGKKLNKM